MTTSIVVKSTDYTQENVHYTYVQTIKQAHDFILHSFLKFIDNSVRYIQDEIDDPEWYMMEKDNLADLIAEWNFIAKALETSNDPEEINLSTIGIKIEIIKI